MRQALELALEALQVATTPLAKDRQEVLRAITAIKEALAQPEQEPLEYWNAVEGWVKIDEVREHFDSVGCATIYKTAGEGRVPLSLALAQPEQEPVAWKLMPREATREMLEAMDECSTEGYDERLYAGHAASVYMAAWDAQQPQPERYITDAMKVRQAVAQALLDDVYAEELEQPEAKQSGTISITTPAPIAYLCENATGHKYFRWKKPSSVYKPIPLYTTPPQRTWVGLTDEEKQEWIDAMPYDPQPRHCMILVNVIEAKLKEKNT